MPTNKLPTPDQVGPPATITQDGKVGNGLVP